MYMYSIIHKLSPIWKEKKQIQYLMMTLCYCSYIVRNYKNKWNIIQNSSAVKKVCGPEEGCCEKICEIQGGSQEMAMMVG